ncbi:D-alanyl-D-alanine carboxypeptidase family protein [Actinacidiphila yeochonensis]|uniref:D-alanyl-D-alanine carboxypeptidase family protein n=1 Tax=Actinacidiphila yeochonensis TaxID=89050 RepID=UPI0005647A8A|nr:D-alanyl-D-alanine carboxypeptidase [Actinacidiphila yeochonensis]
MNAFRGSRRPLPRPLAAAAAGVAAACCLAALAAPPAAAADGGDGSAADASSSRAVGGALLAEPGVQVRPEADTPSLPSDLSALSWTVSDARSGEVLAAKDAHRELPPASTLKTLFADTVLPRFPATLRHKVTDNDLAGLGEGSSLVGVQPGQTYTVADLWRGVFLASGNDAVHVLANMNGSVAHTVADMQAKARMLGADDTHVVTPDGYDEPGQVSSAYDLAVFARTGLADRDFASYASTKDAQFPGGYDDAGSYVPSFGIENTNRLLTGAKGVTPYPGLIGVKNGYTTNAGNTLVAAARRGGRTIIVSLMNPQSGVYNAVYSEASELLDWGFAAAGRTTSVGTLNAAPPAHPADTATAPAAGGADARGQSGRDRQDETSTPTDRPREAAAGKAAAHASTVSTAAWSVGGGLVLVAAACAILLRRRSAGKGH